MLYLFVFFLPISFCLCSFIYTWVFANKKLFVISFCIYVSVLFFSIVIYFLLILRFELVIQIILKSWVIISTLHLDWCFYVDALSCCMLFVVVFISILVHIYSLDYMCYDPHFFKFISFLSLFTFFMLVLIVSPNFIQLFVGWEGVGLCSYLLISFWNSRIQANKAAIKAMLVNRIGDFGLMLGFLLFFIFFKSLNFFVIFPSVIYFCNIYMFFCDFLYINFYNLICFCIFLGAMGKSAQFGLHVWLPDAMEGPTPVSALIHAATMVTAGVYIIIRCSYIFEYAPIILYVITLVGAVTAFYSASIGLVQNDLKRVIAFSTCSQLGYMVLSCGLSSYNVGLFHLMTHAFFKALLFLSAGCVIHSLFNEQDMRKMGGLRYVLPFTYCMFFIGSLALLGFPFLSGFYSKDLILECAFGSYTISSHFAYWLGSSAALLTAFYSIRLLCITFLLECTETRQYYQFISESPVLMLFVLFILCFFSLFLGFFLRDLIVGCGSFFFFDSIFCFSFNVFMLDLDFLPSFIRVLPLCFSFFGCFLAFYIYFYFDLYLFLLRSSSVGKHIYTFLNRRWFVDKIYSEIFNQYGIVSFYYYFYFFLDRGFFEKIGSMSLYDFFIRIGRWFNSFFTGFYIEYIFFFILSLGVLLIFKLFFVYILVITDILVGFCFVFVFFCMLR